MGTSATSSADDFTYTSSGDPTVGILPSYNDAWANWKMAGLQSVGGIATIDAGRSNCTTAQAGETMPLAPSGLTPPVANDDAANINKAITNCPTNTIVRLAAGTFNLDHSENILLNKSVTLRGGTCTGSTAHAYCQTQIVYYNGLLSYGDLTGSQKPGICGTSTSSTNGCNGQALIFVDNDVLYSHRWAGCNSPGNVAAGNCNSSDFATLTADAPAGSTTVSVSTTSIFSVGMWVYINEVTNATLQTDPVTGRGASEEVLSSPDAFNTTGNNPTGRFSYCYWVLTDGTCSAGWSETTAKQFIAQYSEFYDRPYGEIYRIASIANWRHHLR